ncbi:hypothetical protein [Amycolatopsis sp. CA-230715]|uniref:hypothetical protein n=1 Tax=Amycolatopsis sp. CA-230715 TaxID=2745196 RepID=UPI001C025783|nr:hypothetical protein [Amycolatopsis sp. CA-230715]QWF79783.1 hypothetical protein HUW46_03196 [Amycolatopsis sp. CA-230715]
MSRARLAVVAAAVLLGAMTVVLASGHLPWPRGRCGLPAVAPAGTPSSAVSAPDGGGVRVVEQGFSQAGRDGSVSIGALVENTSGSVAYRTRVGFRLFDAAHAPLFDALPGQHRLTVEVPVLLPGQRVGVGTTAFAAAKAAVASVEVAPGTSTWLARDALGRGFSAVTAAYLSTKHPNPKDPSTVDVHYREKSVNCRPLHERLAATIFRDAQGRIVGGTLDRPGQPTVFHDERGTELYRESKRPTSRSCARGEREIWVTPGSPAPPGAEDARTEIYPYCDLARPRYPGQPGDPAN